MCQISQLGLPIPSSARGILLVQYTNIPNLFLLYQHSLLSPVPVHLHLVTVRAGSHLLHHNVPKIIRFNTTTMYNIIDWTHHIAHKTNHKWTSITRALLPDSSNWRCSLRRRHLQSGYCLLKETDTRRRSRAFGWMTTRVKWCRFLSISLQPDSHPACWCWCWLAHIRCSTCKCCRQHDR